LKKKIVDVGREEADIALTTTSSAQPSKNLPPPPLNTKNF
jgi:hypothetical protein